LTRGKVRRQAEKGGKAKKESSHQLPDGRLRRRYNRQHSFFFFDDPRAF
jgi:hypothetical protein